MLVEQRDDGFNVTFLDDVQSFWAFYQDTVEDFQNTYRVTQNVCHLTKETFRPHPNIDS